ncbi:hypothetical protein EDB84DRAFT_1437438 [Lactarius hengduanensis]|nr:hypothetical protein EDB84DRAFT_1437438 [Lactarius hengduanensis]
MTNCCYVTALSGLSPVVTRFASPASLVCRDNVQLPPQLRPARQHQGDNNCDDSDRAITTTTTATIITMTGDKSCESSTIYMGVQVPVKPSRTRQTRDPPPHPSVPVPVCTGNPYPWSRVRVSAGTGKAPFHRLAWRRKLTTRCAGFVDLARGSRLGTWSPDKWARSTSETCSTQQPSTPLHYIPQQLDKFTTTQARGWY